MFGSIAKSARLRSRLGERGISAVEFALIAPAFLMLVVGILEFGLALSAHILMEGAVREAARFGVTGYAPPGQTREETIRQVISDRSYGILDPANVQIATLIYPSFGDIGQPEPFSDLNGNGTRDGGEAFSDVNGNGAWDADMGAAGQGGPNDIVLYRITYMWPMMTGLVRHIVGGDGYIPLSASVAVRNEPFPQNPGGN